jgi:hypothetical protein
MRKIKRKQWRMTREMCSPPISCVVSYLYLMDIKILSEKRINFTAGVKMAFKDRLKSSESKIMIFKIKNY